MAETIDGLECTGCGHVNLPGADYCEECNGDLHRDSDFHPLTDAFAVKFMNEEVSHLCKYSAVSVDKSAKLKSVIDKMVSEAIGAVLVLEGRQVVGILSERDLLMKVAGKDVDVDSATAESIMTRNPETLTTESKVVHAIHKMAVGNYRHVPLTTAKGEPVGILSVRDIIHYFQESH
ncbi:MAG: CBS domain-containing protein [Planctomycetes bacterium]|nr:CBS domain-containing protein [Planctomycetota bacterium]